MRMTRTRKAIAGVGLSAGLLVASAGPAFAHFCYRIDFNEMAASKAGGSNAWLTAEEWRAFLPFIEEDCPAAVPLIEEVLDDADEHTLFMGPGLLAGGTIGKEKGPKHFDYLLEAFSVCGEH
jgi:hypothetical protein